MTEISTGPRAEVPDVDALAQSMLLLHGAHDDHDHPAGGSSNGSWSKAPVLDGERAERLHEATAGDRQRYLTSGLQEVDCRFCHGSVLVKKLGPNHTAVQWNTDASQRCAYFAQLRAEGTDTARAKGCPRLSDSIAHAVAEGCLEPTSTATPPGDG